MVLENRPFVVTPRRIHTLCILQLQKKCVKSKKLLKYTTTVPRTRCYSCVQVYTSTKYDVTWPQNSTDHNVVNCVFTQYSSVTVQFRPWLMVSITWQSWRKTENVVIDISGRIVSGSNLEMGTGHVMDVQIKCHGCPWHSECGLNMVIWDVMGEVH